MTTYDEATRAQGANWSRMQEIHDAAQREGRDLTAAEYQEWRGCEKALRTAVEQLEEMRAETIAKFQEDLAAGKVVWSDPNNFGGTRPVARHASPFLTRDQKLADHSSVRSQSRPEHRDLRLGALLRGVVTGNWSGAEAELRVMNEGSAGAGGVLVPTILSTNLIDRARNIARVTQAGATVVPMANQTVVVPRLTGSTAPAWRAENAAIASGDLTLDSVTLSAKSIAFLVKCSIELLEDSDPNVVGVIEHDLASQVALELDRVALRGSGTAPEPKGVLNQTGVTKTALGTGNGATPTNYDHILDSVQTLRALNFEPNAVIQAPRSTTTLRKLKEATTNAYLTPPPGLPTILDSNQIPTNITVGTSTDTSEVYVADWSKLYLGIRTAPMLFQLKERFMDTGQVGFVIHARADIALAQPGAFSVLTGVRP